MFTATEDDVDVLMSGYAFRLKISHERALGLVTGQSKTVCACILYSNRKFPYCYGTFYLICKRQPVVTYFCVLIMDDFFPQVITVDINGASLLTENFFCNTNMRARSML